ncbi:MAG TPA: HEAT repeat domain-containing protein [Candidatus Sulfotelmatobacter sp.]|nr:HEAT repeat domain-containing protein [Candidatus Sulfotelmatobacter sp.]
MKKPIIGIFALLASGSLCAFAGDGTAAVNTTVSPQAKEIVEEMRGIDMRLGNPMFDDGSPNLKEQHKYDIIDELRAIGPDAIPALIQALGDPDDQMRCDAELAMINLAGGFDGKPKMDIEKALPALVKSMGDTNSNVRAWAAHAIAEMGPGGVGAVPVLIKMLNDPDVGPRNCACIALRNIGPPAKPALPALQKALNDPEGDVRSFARQAIEKIEKPVN